MSEIQECVLYRGMEHGEILLAVSYTHLTLPTIA